MCRVDPQRIDRRADRERLTGTIDDSAAMGDDGGDAHGALIALPHEEVPLDELQGDRLPYQCQGDATEDGDNERRPPVERRCRGLGFAGETGRCSGTAAATLTAPRAAGGERPGQPHADTLMASPLRPAPAAAWSYAAG